MPALKGQDDLRAFAGALQLPGVELDITIRLATVNDAMQAEIDIPLQSLEALPLRVTASNGSTYTLVLDAPVPATLTVTETPNGLKGEFAQSTVTLDVDLKPISATVSMHRPQLPLPPFPYGEADILVQHPEGHSLAGTLTIPKGDGPHPAVVLISGSGPQDRDETLMGHKPFLVLADHLSRQGIAVLRYDDRGVGESIAGEANLADDTSLDFATDVELLVDHLRTRTDIDPNRIGLMGHSEGGLIAPLVAAKRQDAIGFIVLLAGPGVPGGDILTAQVKALLLASGEAPQAVERVSQCQQQLIDAVMSDAPEEDVRASARRLLQSQMAMAEATKDMVIDDNQVDAVVAQIGGPWMRTFIKLDPAEALASVKCPVLALNGTLDLQVPIDQNLPVIERVVRDAGGDVTAVRLEGLNHLFQPATKGTIDEYLRIETTFDPDTLVLITQWIQRKAGMTP
jgi:pimeloyl-ACP methyl ester carboxylesterase